MLRALVIDTESDHNTQDTAPPGRQDVPQEVFAGRYKPAPPVTEFPTSRNSTS